MRRAPAAALCVLLLAPTVAHAAFRPFAPDSIWNLPLRADAPLDAHSGSYVSWLGRQVAAHGAWLNTTTCGMPVYWASAATKPVKVTLDKSSYQDKGLIRAWSAVPMPANAKPANCVDKNLAVLQSEPGGAVAEWEFWRATKASNGSWSARWGGAMTDVRTDRGIASKLSWPGLSAWSWNVTATSISMLGGVITEADVASGRVDHAVALAVPNAAKGRWAWPAERADGGSTDAYALPEGSRLRLDPSLDLSRLSMTPLVRMIAEAAQRYGVVVRDRTYSNTAFIAEQPQAGQPNPYPSRLDGQSPGTALKAFPWGRLQLLRAPSCTKPGACDATERATISVDGTAKVGSPLTLDTSNSTLNQPRRQVLWDLDGDGAYETNANTAVKETFVPRTAGTRTVSVKITTRSGSVVTAKRTIAVAPSG